MKLEVKTIAVIGAGTMGRGIAYASALGGYSTVLEDISAQTLDEGLGWIARVDTNISDRGHPLITTASSVEDAIRDADLIIEAVPEEMEMKMELFTIFDRFSKPGAIFASNTSSLSISEMSELTVSRDRCLGMHFFNPVPNMKLIELVKTPFTSEDTVVTCIEVAQRMGKEVVLVQESPGFITTRVNALIGNEAFAMLDAGIASAKDIDKAHKLGLNHPMGPFELVDLVGLDVRLNILEYLHQTLGEKYRPNRLLKKYVEEGRLGRKAGRGVYDYAERETTNAKI